MTDESATRSIRELLDTKGVPWRETRETLVRRFGVVQHPAYGWEVVEIAMEPALVTGLLWPLCVQVLPQFAPYVPATDYSGIVWFSDDSRDNLHRTREQLEQSLGQPAPSNSSNTLGWCWRAGAALLRLTVWPEDLQSHTMTNYAHDREPRLKSGCDVTIKTGFRLVPTPEERVAFREFERIASIPVGSHTLESVQNSHARESEVEFVREPGADEAGLFGLIGCSTDRQRLIFFGEQLYVLPLEKVRRFLVERTLPAKGPGGSRLVVECTTEYAAYPMKRLAICSETGPEDLNELGAELAARTGKPVELGAHDYDA